MRDLGAFEPRLKILKTDAIERKGVIRGFASIRVATSQWKARVDWDREINALILAGSDKFADMVSVVRKPNGNGTIRLEITTPAKKSRAEAIKAANDIADKALKLSEWEFQRAGGVYMKRHRKR